MSLSICLNVDIFGTSLYMGLALGKFAFGEAMSYLGEFRWASCRLLCTVAAAFALGPWSGLLYSADARGAKPCDLESRCTVKVGSVRLPPPASVAIIRCTLRSWQPHTVADHATVEHAAVEPAPWSHLSHPGQLGTELSRLHSSGKLMLVGKSEYRPDPRHSAHLPIRRPMGLQSTTPHGARCARACPSPWQPPSRTRGFASASPSTRQMWTRCKSWQRRRASGRSRGS